jgi:hypothetical protein
VKRKNRFVFLSYNSSPYEGSAVQGRASLIQIFVFTSIFKVSNRCNYEQFPIKTQQLLATYCQVYFFLDFPIYLQSVEIHSANGVLGSGGG